MLLEILCSCCIHCLADLQSLSYVQWQRFSWLRKSSKLILLMILSGPTLYRKLEFQFGVLTFPLSCLPKTQISLQIFESPLSRHAECYCPIFEPSMLILEVRGARAVRSGCKVLFVRVILRKLQQEMVFFSGLPEGNLDILSI